MRRFMVAILLALFGISIAAGAAILYYEWNLSTTMTGSEPDVRFYKWSDGTFSNAVSMSYNIYADAWVIDSNGTYGIKNTNGVASRTIYLWVESVSDASKFANYTIRILNPSGSEMCKWTTTDFANLGESRAISWTANPNTVYTIYLMYKGSSTAGAGSSTVNLKLKMQA